MSIVEEKMRLRAKPWNPKRALWIAAFAAGTGIAAGWLFLSQEQQDQASGYTEPESLNCPNPPCTIVIRNGVQKCVYQNNQLKACP